VKTLLALLVLIAGIALVGSAEAQPVPGGLPSVDARVTVLEGATQTLQTQVSTLQGQVATLQSQVTALQNSNKSLQSELDTEIASRKDADSVLEAALLKEIFARGQADTALQASISAGSRGFSTFKNESELVEGASAIVGSIGPLPAGNYAVIATATVQNTKNNADWHCQLVRNDMGTVIGENFEGTTSLDITDVFASGGTSTGNVTIPALVSLPDNGIVNMTCETGVAGSSVFKIQMVATSVGTATIGCPALACQ